MADARDPKNAKDARERQNKERESGVYRIKDLAGAAWEQGKLPLPGLEAVPPAKPTPLEKAAEDVAVDLAMTGEIPLAAILEAMRQPPPKPAAKPLQPLGQGGYGEGMIRPEELSELAPLPAAREEERSERLDPKKVQAAKDEMRKMAEKAKLSPPGAKTKVGQQTKKAKGRSPVKPGMEAAEELTPSVAPHSSPAADAALDKVMRELEDAAAFGPPPRRPEKKVEAPAPEKKPPQPQVKPKAQPQRSQKQAAKPQSAPQAAQKKELQKQDTPHKQPFAPKVARHAKKAPLRLASLHRKGKAKTQSAKMKPGRVTAPKKSSLVPAKAKKQPAQADKPLSPRAAKLLAVSDALWNDEAPLYHIAYGEIIRACGRDVYYVGLRIARPVLRFRRRALPVLLRPLQALWFLFRACVLAVYHVSVGRLRATVRAVEKAHRAHIETAEARTLPQRLRWFVRDYKPILRTAGNLVLPSAALVVLLAVVSGIATQTYALKVEYNGQTMYVANEAAFLAAQESALRHITLDEGSAGGYAAPEARYEIVEVSQTKIVDEDTLRDTLWQNYSADLNMTNACGVYVEGELVAIVRSESDALGVLEAIKKEHMAQMALVPGDSIGFVEQIETRQSIFPQQSEKYVDAKGLYDILTGVKEGELVEIAREDDSLYSIAKRLETTEAWLERLNPQLAPPNYLHGGDRVVIANEVGFLQIKVTKTEISKAAVPYERIDTSTSSLYKGEVRTTTKGVNGEDEITRLVTYVNGMPTGSREIARVRTKEPVAERRQVGTKSTRVVTSDGNVININPSAQGFTWPVPALHQITSPYGYRSRGFHTGMDISGSGASGKIVVAAKDGTVEMVARSGSGYGNQIVINHGNGVKTRYAHLLSGSISVSTGTKVTAGQPIARVGSTGNSTGPHLHFEVIINGSTKNPKNYLKMP